MKMKKITKLLALFSVMLILSSCEKKIENKSTDTKTDEKKEISAAANFKKVALNIEGMTCEIGCARTIQSKLSKTEGVKLAKVNFDKKNGVVEYDANTITEKQIVSIVEKIAGGDLYKVTEISAEE